MNISLYNQWPGIWHRGYLVDFTLLYLHFEYTRRAYDLTFALLGFMVTLRWERGV